LIGYDGFSCYGSPSYYAIKMFSQNQGDTILKTTASPGLNQSATRVAATGVIYVKLVNPKGEAAPVEITLQNAPALAPTASAVTLSASDEAASNSIDKPTAVVPVTTSIANIQPSFTYTMAPYSVTVLQLKPR
jgi:alpha-N-arabinofuranosidase